MSLSNELYDSHHSHPHSHYSHISPSCSISFQSIIHGIYALLDTSSSISHSPHQSGQYSHSHTLLHIGHPTCPYNIHSPSLVRIVVICILHYYHTQPHSPNYYQPPLVPLHHHCINTGSSQIPSSLITHSAVRTPQIASSNPPSCSSSPNTTPMDS